MKDKRSIEEQVAELTEKQKDTIVKVGIWGTVILLVVLVPLLVLIMFNLFNMIANPLSVTDEAFLGFEILCIAIVVFLVGYIIVIKKVFPYYSDKKAKYIMKSRKEK